MALSTSTESKRCFLCGIKLQHRIQSETHRCKACIQVHRHLQSRAGHRCCSEKMYKRKLSQADPSWKMREHCFGVAFHLLLASATIFFIKVKFCQMLLRLPDWWNGAVPCLGAIPTLFFWKQQLPPPVPWMPEPECFIKPDFQVLISGLCRHRGCTAGRECSGFSLAPDTK